MLETVEFCIFPLTFRQSNSLNCFINSNSWPWGDEMRKKYTHRSLNSLLKLYQNYCWRWNILIFRYYLSDYALFFNEVVYVTTTSILFSSFALVSYTCNEDAGCDVQEVTVPVVVKLDWRVTNRVVTNWPWKASAEFKDVFLFGGFVAGSWGQH